MGNSKRDATNERTNIQCIEVLIFRNYVANSSNSISWTLSVYSLENHPVKRNRTVHNSEIFHFMVYDWKRTIRNLLEDNQVPYSIIQYFDAESVYSDANSEEIYSPDKEDAFLSAIAGLPQNSLASAPGLKNAPDIPEAENADILR